MKKKLFFIVNSRIGDTKIETLKNTVNSTLNEFESEIRLTEYGGHATDLAKEAITQNPYLVVAVGGDGTVNEVIQVIAHTNVNLAIIPTGSGNGLARHCGIPLQIEQAVKLILHGCIQEIDLGKANDIYFISNAGVGFDAWVCNTIRQTKSRGLKMYVKQVILNYFSYKPSQYEINADGTILKQKAFFLNVANGKEFGYGFEIASGATLQDGMLDLVLVKSINFFNGFKFVLDGWRKNLKNNSNCILLKAKKITITSDDLPYFQTDGDSHSCQNSCEIEIQPKALHLLVSKSITNL